MKKKKKEEEKEKNDQMEMEDDEDTIDEGDGAGEFGGNDSGSVAGAPKQSGGDLRPQRPPDLLRQVRDWPQCVCLL